MSKLQSYTVESIANHVIFGISFYYLRLLFGSEVVVYVYVARWSHSHTQRGAVWYSCIQKAIVGMRIPKCQLR